MSKKSSGKSFNLQQELREYLHKNFPSIFSEGRVDYERLKRALGEELDDHKERYGLSWAGKRNCFRAIQTPTTATLKPARDQSVNFDTTNNIFIEGDNLEVLKVLQRSYYGKVKMIYIDPPYNTGHDFIYNDKFAQHKREYLQQVGALDAEGNVVNAELYRQNSREAGHFHSTWLNMIYPRLFVARNLLRHDGVIFVSIDDNEVHNLRMIMNEIFGEENFVAQFIWNNSTGGGLRKKHVNNCHEYILLYAKNSAVLNTLWAPLSEKGKSQYNKKDDNGLLYREQQFAWQNNSTNKNQKYPIAMPDGIRILPKKGYIYRFVRESFERLKSEGKIVFKQTKQSVYETEQGEPTEWSIAVKDYLGDALTAPISILPKEHVKMNIEAASEIKNIFNRKIFDYSKPNSLLKYFLQIGTRGDNIILDFFAGSATTAHAVMAQNAHDGGARKYICVQLPEVCPEESEARKAGYNTIADIATERIRRAGAQIEKEKKEHLNHSDTPLDTGVKVFRLSQSNFKIWNPNIKNEEELLAQMREFVDAVQPDSSTEDILYELILKSGLDLNVDIVEKEIDNKKYFLLHNTLAIYLGEHVTEPLIENIIAQKPHKVVCLDRAFKGNDQLMTNTHLQLEYAKIEFEVL